MKLYKVTGPNGEAIHGGSGKWPLPNGKKPGGWTKERTPNFCVSGWHLIPAHALGLWWRDGAVLWEAEGRGECSLSNEKSAYTSARLLRRIGVLTPKARKAYDEACEIAIEKIFGGA